MMTLIAAVLGDVRHPKLRSHLTEMNSALSWDPIEPPTKLARPPRPRKPISASPAALARFMKAQPKSSVKRMSGSRSVMSQSRELLGDMFRNLKEAEAAPPEDGSLVGRPRRRKRPSATNSLDGNEFRDMLVKSREDDAPSVLLEDSPRKRGPPKATKSLDGNEFRSQLGDNKVCSLRKIDKDSGLPSSASELPTSSKSKDASPDARTKFTSLHSKSSTKKTGSSGSVQYQPPKAIGETARKEEELEHCPLGSQMKGTQLRTSKLFGDDSPDDSSRRRAPPKSTKSLDEINLVAIECTLFAISTTVAPTLARLPMLTVCN